MSAHNQPARRPEGHAVVGVVYGLLFTVILFALILVPAVLVASGLWWVVLIIAAALWLIAIRNRWWRR